MTLTQYIAGAAAILFICILAIISVAGGADPEEEDDMATAVYTIQITQVLGQDSKLVHMHQLVDKKTEDEYMQIWAKRIEERLGKVIHNDNVTCSKIQIFATGEHGSREW